MPEELKPTDPGFTAYPTPATYTVAEKSMLNNRIYEAGETVEYDGLPAENLIPTCDVGRARYQDYLATNAQRVARLRDTYADQPGIAGDQVAFQKAVAAAIAESNAQHAQQMAELSGLVAKLLAQIAAPAAKPAKAAKDAGSGDPSIA